jgi:hypothetical protein
MYRAARSSAWSSATRRGGSGQARGSAREEDNTRPTRLDPTRSSVSCYTPGQNFTSCNLSMKLCLGVPVLHRARSRRADAGGPRASGRDYGSQRTDRSLPFGLLTSHFSFSTSRSFSISCGCGGDVAQLYSAGLDAGQAAFAGGMPYLCLEYSFGRHTPERAS